MYNAFDEALERIKRATGARTQVDLAAILGIRQSSISDAKRRQSIPADWLLKLYRSHGLNPDWITSGEAPQVLREGMALPVGLMEPGTSYGSDKPKSRAVTVSSMTGIIAEDGSLQEKPIEMIAIPEAFICPGQTIFKMEHQNMEPIVRRGAYIGVNKDQRQLRSGEIFAVSVPNEGFVVRRLFNDFENNRVILRSENPTYKDQSLKAEDIVGNIIGRVWWVLQEL
ncbi:LexA family transcriptional regulator [Fundidesulfovibrio agrisoli]|uniref:LexA family transcriptional regulator n=1 Tax=Fundidesulfovibrio agrisoli TaxID=2922717 RepID=UPI001FAB8923|nr:S24 family peptidase [Fundidesulfovibrio agrisoli]